MSKEHAYAYEAGYRDGSIHYELEHCPACKNVADLQEALAENAKLREELEAVGTAAYLYGRTDLEAENAKLRELCGFMLRCMKRNHHCDCCLVNGEYCEISYIESDARELGIEVDG